jgi:hypothetical protein
MTLATMLCDWLEQHLNWDLAVPALMSAITGFSVLGIASLFGATLHFGSIVLGASLYAVVRLVFKLGVKVWTDDDERDS